MTRAGGTGPGRTTTLVTVTLNTALDLTYRVPELRPHASHRVTEVSERPGGKGLNVARVLAALGHPVTVTGFAGGATGDAVRQGLAGVGGLVDALVPTAGATRRTVAVVDRATGDTTQLNEAGPLISAAEWAAFQEVYVRLLTSASAVALCGSLPPGVPVDGYGTLVRAARAAGVPVLLDTSGEPLRHGVAAGPDLIKPNTEELAELAELAGLAGLAGARDPERAVREVLGLGAGAVVASLGGRGLLAVVPEGTWRAAPPERVEGNPTGAGDSAVAGLLSGLADDGAGTADWPRRLVRAVALSTATVLAPAAGEFDAAAYRELLERVVVSRDDGAGSASDGPAGPVDAARGATA